MLGLTRSLVRQARRGVFSTFRLMLMVGLALSLRHLVKSGTVFGNERVSAIQETVKLAFRMAQYQFPCLQSLDFTLFHRMKDLLGFSNRCDGSARALCEADGKQPSNSEPDQPSNEPREEDILRVESGSMDESGDATVVEEAGGVHPQTTDCPDTMFGETGGLVSSLPVTAPQDNNDPLTARLAPWGLEMYAETLKTQGYDVEVFAMLADDEIDEMLRIINCKAGHRVRFRRLLDANFSSPVTSPPCSAR